MCCERTAVIGEAEFKGGANCADSPPSVSQYDPLTGLLKWCAFRREFEKVDWRTGPHTILICHLDGIDLVVERGGLDVARRVCCHFAQMLCAKSILRDGAVLARIGADEFCVVLPHAAITDAKEFIDDVEVEINDALTCQVTPIWGVAENSRVGFADWELFDATDAALEQAKVLNRLIRN
jgi:diguanylate cyclase (GGDEF)-like protein